MNNAGISFRELALDLSADKLDAVLNVNLRALAEHHVDRTTKAGLLMAPRPLPWSSARPGSAPTRSAPTVTLTDAADAFWTGRVTFEQMRGF